ncbi:probable rhodanese domain-containing dual specificity protein phosphatase [Watersipora subatra]|uniref:probable rhodanese domain-containing dual specificity protein phosphatase n=1 Tax=Watersipora subatra TaxID=2589382 RepID=UPI00355ADB43
MGSASSSSCCSRNAKVATVGTIQSNKPAKKAHFIGLCVKPFQLPIAADGHISCADLYNLMNDANKFTQFVHHPLYLLILDLRDAAAYALDHIQTAFHCSSVASGIINENILNFKHIVLYGVDTSLGSNERAESAVRLLEDAGAGFVMLVGGYTEFEKRFPFLCNTVTIWSQTERERKVTTYPSLILEDWLYQGTGNQAKRERLIRSMGITHVINISTEFSCDLPGVTYLAIRLQDDASSKLLDHFEEIFEFLDGVKRTGGKALVHCNLGVSRSSTATLSYIMLSQTCTLLDAYKFLHHRRPCCAPNRGFFLQLGFFEEYIFGKKFTDANQLWFAV